MRKLFLTIALVTTVTALTGCAGRDFVRADSADFKVGRSTYSQVVDKMGKPRSTGEALKNGETIKTITYAYASTGGEPLQPGVIPARAMAYYFHRDLLVGQEFVSSFKSDNSNFDETKVPGIEKGKTTRSEVVQVFGQPTAFFTMPMVKETSGEAIGYTYQSTSGNAFTGFKFFRKTLRIAFDPSDKVLDVDYSTSGSN
jgi:outer membrane protein assembly factor BamE (lipoprotein component of BamABCDE complex)